MKLNAIKFEKANGGMGRPSASKDVISGLIFGGMGLNFGSAIGSISGFDSADGGSYIKKFLYPEELEDCGIVYKQYEGTALQDEECAMNALYYHVSEYFRINPNGVLYVMVKGGTTAVAATDLQVLQNYANGEVRQVGVYAAALPDVTAFQTELTALEAEHKPMSCIVTYSGKDVTLDTLKDAEIRAEGKCNVSVLVGCDFTPQLSGDLGDYAYYGCIGACMGAISKAAVHECIAWVQKFPLGLASPALFNGNLIRNVSNQDQELLNNNYIFVITHVGDADCYFSDSHTLDVSDSDYAYIENVRTIDKACRGVYANMLPHLAGPLQVDASTGKLAASTVAFLETEAGRALEDMEKAGELSGYKAEIDPEQNVLAASALQIVIKQVGIGVMRTVNVKIGFATKI